ncbi:UDP-N-acetylmuramoyl-L-alanyl-D-glutamate--2,6-diaminopimelate ligase [Peribacillus frigoritolerans]|uniref:UDP-N-acetylmuramoyl-L-alanyl-D-glutamate--2, 6-diaminopimelate ligase n=1 Tax=Peribacillus frigoritolerans TaxID=450367 RepID=UPI001EFE137E|nr:UDP-N-acetylmuramoyl-L-alanyl-D-glutamate--2,6-diaminopimelate ligase [Peribacillus frigoritolerans]ULM99468.1 UDP-N-acetylmuramoyl-L-alanyl-D-glutamate--2,6-diaminopimelate ligase [Peribacillus frigoritolerans]
MILKDILKKAINGDLPKDVEHISITGVTDNSKEIKKGFLFVAVTGYKSDGHNYIYDAIRLGASAVIGNNRDIKGLEVPYLRVENSRKALGQIAKRFYGDPSNQKIMIGITGTNGKTTTSYMLQQILEENGVTCSVIGTIQHTINGNKVDSHNTTPGTMELNSLLVESRDMVVIMEVSSHGLAQYRLEGIEFDFCVFTNLYHDHLDFHGTMEDYFLAKLLLFEKLKPSGLAVINGDDFWGGKLQEYLWEKNVRAFVFGKSNRCDLAITNYNTATNPFILLNEKQDFVKIELPLPGLHNLYNATAAYSVAKMFPISKQEILTSLKRFSGVPGRFEIYKKASGPTIVIDYAHTADAIHHLLQTAKECGAKKIYHIFGFRGGRDTTKRAEMVKVFSEHSDVLILTMDDLNSDGMESTLNKLLSDYSAGNGKVIPDRTFAIQEALQAGKEGDWIIITGKGIEWYDQKFGLPTISDKETVLYLQNEDQGDFIGFFDQ